MSGVVSNINRRRGGDGLKQPRNLQLTQRENQVTLRVLRQLRAECGTHVLSLSCQNKMNSPEILAPYSKSQEAIREARRGNCTLFRCYAKSPL